MGNFFFGVGTFVYTPSKETIEEYIFPAPRAEGNLQYFIDNYRNIKLVTVDYNAEQIPCIFLDNRIQKKY